MAVFSDPRPILLDSTTGMPILTGRIWFYAAGTVNTLKAVYTDASLTILAQNPMPLDGNGRVPQLYYTTGQYKIVVEKQIGFEAPPDDVWLSEYSCDYVDGSLSAVNAALSSVIYVANLATLRTLSPIVYPSVWVGGNTNSGDGGGGLYVWTSSITNPDDNGWYIQLGTGGSGRYVRQRQSSESSLSIQIWMGNSTSVIDSSYSYAAAFCSNASIPLEFPIGNYKFTSSTTFAGSNLSFIIDQSTKYTLATPGYLTFNLPLTIKSTEALTDASVTTLNFTALTGLKEIDYNWYYNNVITGTPLLPIYVNQSVSIGSTGYLEFHAGLIAGENAQFTLANLAELNVIGSFATRGAAHQYFVPATTFLGSAVLLPKMDVVEASWFGCGIVSGDATYNLKSAAATAYNINAQLNVPACQFNGVLNSFPNGLLMETNGYITCGTATVINNIQLQNDPLDAAFSVGTTPGAQITLLNEIIYPEWFGAKLTSDDTNAFNLLLANQAAHACKINCNNRSYIFTNPLTVPRFSALTPWSMSDIYLDFSSISALPLATDMSTILWDNVIVYGSVNTLAFTNLINSNIRNCTINGSTTITCNNLNVLSIIQNNTFSGNASYNGFSNTGNGSLDINHNIFTYDASVNLIDNSGYIVGINFMDNTFVTASGYAGCDLFLKATSPNTKVQGVIIRGNKFTQLPDASNVATTYSTTPYLTGTFRINPTFSGSGSWSPDYAHTIIVTDNLADGNCNFCRKTIGSGPVLASDLGVPGSYESGINFDSNSKQIFYLPVGAPTGGINTQQSWVFATDNEYGAHSIGTFKWGANYLFWDSVTSLWSLRFVSSNEIGVGQSVGINASWRIYS